MVSLPNDLEKRLLYILHHGLTEIRNLALASGNEQIADLADALEILPGMIDHWEKDSSEMVQFVLRTYQDKYPECHYDYLARLEERTPPDRF